MENEIAEVKEGRRNNLDWHTILKSTERALTWQGESIEALKSLARIIFGASSVVIPLFGTLQIFNQVQEDVRMLYIIILALMGLLYGVLVYFSLKLLQASQFFGPISMDWNDLTAAYYGKSDEDILMQEIVANLNAINKNYPIIDKKKRWAKIISLILPGIILLALAATILSKIA
jgi:hypothetical protein